MARIKAGKTTRKRHKKVIKQAKGYFGRKGTNYKIAKQAVMKSGVYAYFGRKRRKREFRKTIEQRTVQRTAPFQATDRRNKNRAYR